MALIRNASIWKASASLIAIAEMAGSRLPPIPNEILSGPLKPHQDSVLNTTVIKFYPEAICVNSKKSQT